MPEVGLKMAAGRDVVAEAVADVAALKAAAVETVRGQLLEAMAPRIRAMVERELRGLGNEDVDRLRRAKDGYGETEFEEGREKGDKRMADKERERDVDMESLSAMFPNISEDDAAGAEDEDVQAPIVGPNETPAIPTLGEAEVEEGRRKDDDEEGDVDETIEISEDELARAYESALQAEAMVSKGFKDMSTAGEEIDAGAGIADVKAKAAKPWEEEDPPAMQDYSVKEMVRRGMEENKQLRENLGKAIRTIKHLGARLSEVNLFNAKVLHVNKILNRHGRLTREQKRVVLEHLDSAASVDEVQKIYATLESAFRTAGLVQEGARRAPKANAQGARRSGSPDPEVLREGADAAAGVDQFARLRVLAGICR